ncbi:DUF2231 domain-containing protein [Effusibacillus dendaii]|uniref:DUF2231 domain-containing protein n=1 Tax=Effusibacillus dendaii TaxID=2743772 RepID=A0A7I8DGF3_9BACL|nr:DUF2231 domain-containing protein [Effusibacillus dendaii]BCJ87670.1 hypothetical protein skT53_26550 [Effusibacillus dendaii]
MSYLIRNAHFLVIHIPIAMLLFSFVFDLLATILKKKDWHIAGLFCLVIGTLGAIAAVITGPEGERNPLFPQHELFGKLTMMLSILLTLVRLGILWRKKVDIGKNLVYLLVMLVGVGLLSYTGHLGGKMVHPDRSQMHKGQVQQQGGVGQENTNRPTGIPKTSGEGSR